MFNNLEKKVIYFQDQITKNHCFGCGPDNEGGLAIKSQWQGDTAVCEFHPKPHHCAGPTKFLNGGIIATIIDCHCICTAMAHHNKCSDLQLGSSEHQWYATESLTVHYKRPVSMATVVNLIAKVTKQDDRRIELSCELLSNGKVCATATVIAISVPSSWMA